MFEQPTLLGSYLECFRRNGKRQCALPRSIARRLESRFVSLSILAASFFSAIAYSASSLQPIGQHDPHRCLAQPNQQVVVERVQPGGRFSKCLEPIDGVFGIRGRFLGGLRDIVSRRFDGTIAGHATAEDNVPSRDAVRTMK